MDDWVSCCERSWDIDEDKIKEENTIEKELFSKGKSALAVGTAGVVTTISSATTTYGNWIDTAGFNSYTVSLSMAIGSGNTITAIFFQEADVASTYSDAATSDTTKYLLEYPTQFPISAATALVRIGCLSKKRFVRVAITTSGSQTVTVLGIGELNHSITQPTDIYSSTLAASSINAPSTVADSTVTPPKR
jgi:hypothetical protein